MKLWGLLLELAASLALAIASLRNSFGSPAPLCVAYVATAAAQWLVALPLLVALLRRRAPSSRPSAKHGFTLTALLIGVMMTGSLVLRSCCGSASSTTRRWREGSSELRARRVVGRRSVACSAVSLSIAMPMVASL